MFSPWVSEIGLPIYASADFDLEEHYQAAHNRCEDAPPDEDDTTVATPPPSPQVASATARMDEVDALQPLCILPDSIGLPPSSCRATPPSQPQLTASSPAHSAPFQAVNSKSKSKKSSHERRRAKRLAEATAEGRAGSKPLKAAAIKRWKNAAPMQCVTDGSDETGSVAEALARDNSTIRATSGEPILTDMSLEMENVRIASSAFVGERLAQTAEDVRPMSREDWEARGHEYIAWDGRYVSILAVICGFPVMWIAGHVGQY